MRSIKTNPCIIISLITLLSACVPSTPQMSVKRLDLTDGSADSFYLQANYNHAGGRITQVEIEQRDAQMDIILSGAQDASGRGEHRLRYLDQPNPDNNQLVGSVNVDSQHRLQQVSVRSVFHVDDQGRFQFDVSPQLSMMRIESSYSTAMRAINIDLDKFGAGIVLNMKVPVYKVISLNLSENWLRYSGDTNQSTLSLYLRVQPSKNLHVDIGQYRSYLDFGTDSQLSYEQRVPGSQPCGENCTYIYDDTKNSDVEIETAGYRVGLGWYF
ncbi:hypothetical protein [Cellvibrio sp. UBA7671]|uniref:hypothetical protein n=1 Tax=Cellvibrio sp. UBA7671 TaxID=1946312 RepID=UPI002F357AD1